MSGMRWPGVKFAVRVFVIGVGALVGVGGMTTGRGPVVVSAAFASGGAKVRTEVPVTAMNLLKGTASNSPLLVADPHDDRVVMLANRLDGPTFGCALQVSRDRGRSWRTLDPVPDLPPGAEKCYAPEAAFDASGTLHYLFVGLHGEGNSPMGAFLVASRDDGRTWSAPHQVLGPDRFQVGMVVDPTVGRAGRIHLVWVEAGSAPALGGFAPGPNPIMASHSDDGGRGFSAPVVVSGADRRRVVAPSVAVDSGHRLHVVFYDLGADARDYQGLEGPVWEGRWSLVTASSDAEARRFDTESVIDDAVVPSERVMLIFTMPPPSVVVGPGRGLLVAWHDARNGDSDVFSRRSADGGRSWAGLRRLNDDPIGNGLDQFLPRLSVAPNGRVDAVFYDRRLNPANLDNDVFYTRSDSSGDRWAPNVRLTSSSSDSRTGPRYGVASAQGLVEFGGRIALLSARSSALAAWTDTRNATRGGPAQDIFATEIDHPAGATARPWMTAAIALIVALVLGVGARRKWRPAAGGRRRHTGEEPRVEAGT